MRDERLSLPAVVDRKSLRRGGQAACLNVNGCPTLLMVVAQMSADLASSSSGRRRRRKP